MLARNASPASTLSRISMSSLMLSSVASRASAAARLRSADLTCPGDAGPRGLGGFASLSYPISVIFWLHYLIDLAQIKPQSRICSWTCSTDRQTATGHPASAMRACARV